MTTVRTSIPQSPEELTTDWLTAALRQGGHLNEARVTGFETEVVGQGVGFVGLLARIKRAPQHRWSASSLPRTRIRARSPPSLGSTNARCASTAT